MWILRKKSRSGLSPYRGPTCQAAGVREEVVYFNEAEAKADAEKLSAVNLVGFDVVEVYFLEAKGTFDESIAVYEKQKVEFERSN